MTKAMLIRIGNDTHCDGSKIFGNSTFDFIPIQEEDEELIEFITYNQIPSRAFRGKYLSDIHPKLKNKQNKLGKCHMDPYFPDYYKYKTFDNPTYCDPGTIKSEFLKTLCKGDILVFYWGIKQKNKKELYIIGYFVVEKIIDLNLSKGEEITELRKKYFSAHLIRKSPMGVLVIGAKGMLLNKPICLTNGMKKGSTTYVVKGEYEKLLGLSELQSPSYFVKVLMPDKFKNLTKILPGPLIKD